MHNASLSLDLGESITIRVSNQVVEVHVWLESNGTLSISTNRGDVRDNLQVRYVDGKLISISSPEGEPVSFRQ